MEKELRKLKRQRTIFRTIGVLAISTFGAGCFIGCEPVNENAQQIWETLNLYSSSYDIFKTHTSFILCFSGTLLSTIGTIVGSHSLTNKVESLEEAVRNKKENEIRAKYETLSPEAQYVFLESLASKKLSQFGIKRLNILSDVAISALHSSLSQQYYSARREERHQSEQNNAMESIKAKFNDLTREQQKQLLLFIKEDALLMKMINETLILDSDNIKLLYEQLQDSTLQFEESSCLVQNDKSQNKGITRKRTI